MQTRLETQKLHRGLGITSPFVTHDPVEAMTLAQRMMVMNAGRMEGSGAKQLVARTDEGVSAPALDPTIALTPNADRVHHFDTTTGLSFSD